MSIQSQGKHDKKGRLVQPTYPDGRTKQAFKDEADINKILRRAQKAGTMSHLEKYESTYGDFADFDFFGAQIQLTKGRDVFDALPSELRSEFDQSPAAFFDYVNDPANVDDLRKKLPGLALAKPENIEVSGKAAADAESEREASEKIAADASALAEEDPPEGDPPDG